MMMVMVMPVRMTVVDLWALLPSMSSQVSAQTRAADDGDDENNEANYDDDDEAWKLKHSLQEVSRKASCLRTSFPWRDRGAMMMMI